jgi:hypothetical protein
MAGLTAFEIAVLRELDFKTIALPFGGDGKLGWRLKMLGRQVHTNDFRQAETCQAIALVENNGFILGATQIDAMLCAARDDAEDETAPYNGGLLRWFTPTEARWFEGFRRAVLENEDRMVQALAMTLGLRLGDYWLSFDEESKPLRPSLEDAAVELSTRFNLAVDNHRSNTAACFDARQFIVQAQADLLYAALPDFAPLDANRPDAWREIWTSGEPDVWADLAKRQHGTFGGRFLSKTEYKATVKAFFRRARHFNQWAVSISGRHPLTPGDLADCLADLRPSVKTYSKDVSECPPGGAQHIVVF